MIEHAKERKIPGGTWGPPLAGAAGTVAGIRIGFSRIGTEPQWKTVLVGVGCSVVMALGGACLIGLELAVWSEMRPIINPWLALLFWIVLVVAGVLLWNFLFTH